MVGEEHALGLTPLYSVRAVIVTALWCPDSGCVGAVFPLLGGWPCWRRGGGGLGCFPGSRPWRPLSLFGGVCSGVTCPGEGAWSSHLVLPARDSGSGVRCPQSWAGAQPFLSPFPFPRAAEELGRFPPPALAGLWAPARSRFVQAGIFLCRRLPHCDQPCPPLSAHGFCLRVCPWALSHSWAVSWASDVSSLWLQTGFEIIFGKPLAVETDTALPADGCACQISWVDLPLFHQPPSSSSKTEAQSSEVTETVTQ